MRLLCIIWGIVIFFYCSPVFAYETPSTSSTNHRDTLHSGFPDETPPTGPGENAILDQPHTIYRCAYHNGASGRPDYYIYWHAKAWTSMPNFRFWMTRGSSSAENGHAHTYNVYRVYPPLNPNSYLNVNCLFTTGLNETSMVTVATGTANGSYNGIIDFQAQENTSGWMSDYHSCTEYEIETWAHGGWCPYTYP
jgi:hypothetical protein